MDDIAAFTELQARDFYSNSFLPSIRFNDLPSGVDVRLVDIAINLGVTGAINILEMVLLQWPLTGHITDDLIKMINSYDAKCIVLALSAAYISNKHTKPTWITFGHGWTNRNIDGTQKCLALV
jgi:lysozyme family protein